MLDASALPGLLRQARVLLAEGGPRGYWASRALGLVADWVLVVALLALTWRLTDDLSVVALLMLARLATRALVVAAGFRLVPSFGARLLFWLDLARVPLLVGLLLVDSRSDLAWAAAIVAIDGALSALQSETHATILPRLVPRRQLGRAVTLNVALERLTFVLGPLLAAALLWLSGTDAAFVAAALLLAAAALLGWMEPALRAIAVAPDSGARSVRRAWAQVRGQSTLLLLAGGLFAGAALAISLKVALVAVAVDELDRSEAWLGLLLALVGAGTLAGPLSIPRLLSRIPVALIVTGSVVAVVGCVVIVSQVGSLVVVAAVLLGVGVISITSDMVMATATRRLAPEDGLVETLRLMAVAVVAGQLVGAAALALGVRLWSVSSALLVVSVGCAALMGVLFVMGPGRLLVAARRAPASRKAA